MASPGLHCFDIFEIYAQYCDIVSRNGHSGLREDLDMLSKSLESRVQSRDAVFPEIFKLMSLLDLSADFHQFSCFYDFVFFICRENGQKNISVSRALTAWRLVLNGRFRLLHQWCDFVEKHQRHNVSEDTWRQLLGFSQCVNEDLNGYDPKGAWPILIDDFAEHLYRSGQANNHISWNTSCGSEAIDAMETQPGSISSNSCTEGLYLLPRSKRKYLLDDFDDVQSVEDIPIMYWPENSVHVITMYKVKRTRHNSYDDAATSHVVDNNTGDPHAADIMNHLNNNNTLPWAVEDSLSIGFKGHLDDVAMMSVLTIPQQTI